MKTIALGKGIILCQNKIHKMLFKDDILLFTRWLDKDLKAL